MAEATLSPTKDTYLSDSSPNNNYGGSSTVSVMNVSGPQVNNVLVSFDLSGLNAVSIESATLGMYVHARIASGTVKVYKLTRNDWVESTANWNRYKTGSNWSTAGGDYVTSKPSGASGTPPTTNNWWTTDVTAIVSDALTNSVQANFILVGTSGSSYTFRTKENFTESTRPYLDVTYTTVTAPTVTTSAVSNITHNSAQSNGNITDTGGENCDKRGFVYGTTSKSAPGNVAPTSSGYDDYENETGTYSTGAYNLTLSSLDSGTTYYVRAYAHNSAGYAYGGEVSFTTANAYNVSITTNLSLSPSVTFTKGKGVVITTNLSLNPIVTRTANYSRDVLTDLTLTSLVTRTVNYAVRHIVTNLSMTPIVTRTVGYTRTISTSLSLTSIVSAIKRGWVKVKLKLFKRSVNMYMNNRNVKVKLHKRDVNLKIRRK